MKGRIGKRCKCEGSCRHAYTIVVTVGSRPDGRRVRKWHSGFRTYGEAKAALTELDRSIQNGVYTPPSKQTLTEHAEAWLRSQPELRNSTRDSYATQMRVHVLPTLGHRRLRDITPDEINALYRKLELSGRKDGKGGLAPSSVAYIGVVLKKCLGDGARKAKITRNPAKLADPPSRKTRTGHLRTWTGAECRAFLDATADDRLSALWRLALSSGLRRGEVVGLHWSDLDLDTRRIAIKRTLVRVGNEVQESRPKTDRSRRSVPLPAEAVAALRAWKAQQAAERLALGSGWVDTGLVFTKEDGTPLDPDWVSKRFGKLSARAGLPKIRLHDTRHTWATLGLEAGVAPKVVSEILGHSSIAVTLDIYSHVSPAMEEGAVERVAALFE